MDEFELFDKIDLKDISKKTMINIKDLEYIKNEDFDNLSKTKGLGFIKILEREYEVDLSQKREKLINYLKEHDKYKTKEFFIVPPSKKKYSKYIAFFILILMLVGIAVIFYLKKPLSFPTIEKNCTQNPIVKKAKQISGIEINSTNTNEDNSSKYIFIEKNVSIVADDNQSALDEDENKSKVQNIEINSSKSVKSMDSMDSNVSKEEVLIDKNISEETKTFPMKNRLILSPKSKLWVGIVNMKNYKRKSYIQDKNLTIAVKSDMLIATGHGEFTLYYKDKNISFFSKYPIRFYLKDGNLTQINKQEFIELNKGRYW